MQNTDTTKYIIHTRITADGIIERPDIVGAIFGQTEGLLGTDLDLRELQKTGRIGRIEVMATTKAGKTRGNIFIPSSLDKVRTSVLAASLETIDRVGPCTATIEVTKVEDVRAVKRASIIERAKVIYTTLFDDELPESQEIADVVRESVRIEGITFFGKNKIPAGPLYDSDTLIIVEGRADVLTLLKYGIKNTVSVGGTNIPPEVAELTKGKTVTVFTDGDRGGELIIRELMQVAKVDYIARPPDGKAVEDLVQKEIVLALRRKLPADQYAEKYGISVAGKKPRHDDRGDKRSSIAAKLMEKKASKRVEKIRKEDYVRERPERVREDDAEDLYFENVSGDFPEERPAVKKSFRNTESVFVSDDDESFRSEEIVSGRGIPDRSMPDKRASLRPVGRRTTTRAALSGASFRNRPSAERADIIDRDDDIDRDDRIDKDDRIDRDGSGDRDSRINREYRGNRDNGDRGSGDSEDRDSGVLYEKAAGFRETAEISMPAPRFDDQIRALSGTLAARLLNDDDEVVEELPVRDLAARLKKGIEPSVRSVVFDGVVTQRLIDIAEEQNISNIVGLKMGSVVKRPADMTITVLR